MATSDAFTQQIIRLVRSMSDDAILALVKNQLGLQGFAGGRGVDGASVSRAWSLQKPKARGKATSAPSVAPVQCSEERTIGVKASNTI